MYLKLETCNGTCDRCTNKFETIDKKSTRFFLCLLLLLLFIQYYLFNTEQKACPYHIKVADRSAINTYAVYEYRRKKLKR